MGEISEAQAKLLHQIDGYRRTMSLGQDLPESDIEMTAYAKLHALGSCLKPSSDSPFGKLATWDLNDFSNYIPSIINEAQTFREYEPLTQFAAKRLKLVSLFHAVAMSTGDEFPERKAGMIVFARELNATLRFVQRNEPGYPCVFTPIQILSALVKKIGEQGPLLVAALTEIEPEGTCAAKVTKVLKDILSACTECLANNDVLLLMKLDTEDFLKIRTTIADLAFYISFIAVRFETNVLNECISEILYLIDMLWTYRSAVPHLKTNPLDVARCAEAAFEVFSNEEMQDMATIMRDTVFAYSVCVAHKKTTERLVHFLCENMDYFEVQFRRLISSGKFDKANDAIIAFYQVFASLTLLEFDIKEASVFDPEVVIGARVQLDARFAAAREAIQGSKYISEPEISLAKVYPLFINPSPSSQGFLFEVSNISAEDVLNNLLLNSKELDKFQMNGPNALENLTELRKSIIAISYGVQKIGHDKVSELNKILIDKFNSHVVSVIEQKCVRLTSYTPKMALSELVIYARHIIEDLQLVCKIFPHMNERITARVTLFNKAIEVYNKLNNKYSDSLLVADESVNRELFNEIRACTQEFEVYDKTIRDCYFAKTMELMLSRIGFLAIYMNELKHTPSAVGDVIDDLNKADILFRKISHQCGYANHGFDTAQILRVIAHSVRSLSGIRLALVMSTPKRVQARIGELREKLEPLPELLKIVGCESGKVLEFLSKAKWKMMHLSEYYSFDKALGESLANAITLIGSAIRLIGDSAIQDMYKNLLIEVHHMATACDTKTERTGDEPHRFSATIKGWINQVTVSFDPSKTAEAREVLENLRIELNNAIIAMNMQPMKLTPFVDVSMDHKGSFIEKFAGVAIQKLTNTSLFDHAVKEAELMQFPQDLKILKEHQELLNNIINTRDVPFENIQEKLTIPIVCYLITSKKVYYGNKDRFLACAIEFETANVTELGELCFELSEHFHGVYEKIYPMSILLEAQMKEFLVKRYEQRSNLTLADVVYYTKKYMGIMKDANAKPIFQMIIPPLKECFHVCDQVYVVDCSEAIMYLNGTVPDPIRLRKIAQLVREREEKKGFSVKLRPLQKARRGSSLHPGEEVEGITERDIDLPEDANQDPGDEDEDVPTSEEQVQQDENTEPEQEKYIEPEQVEEAEPVEETVEETAAEMIMDPIAKIVEQEPKDVREPHEQLPQIEEFEQNVHVTVEEEGGKALWQSFLVTKLTKTEKCAEKQSTEWAHKCFMESELKYTHVYVEKPAIPMGEWTPINELNLPKTDLSLAEKDISDFQISEMIRWISNKNAIVDCETRPLASIFSSKFKNRKVVGLSTSINIESGNTHPVFNELIEASFGTTVKPIDTTKVSKVDLMNSLVQAVSRFIDILTPQNMDAFVDYLSVFDKHDLSVLKDWIEVVFNPRRYSHCLFTRFMSSVGCYIRTIVNNGDEKRIEKMKKVAIYFIRIATVIALVKSAKHNEKRVLATNDRASAIADFVEGCIALISTGEANREMKLINLYFVEFMEIIAPMCDPKCWSDCYNAYLDAMQVDGGHIKFAITSIKGLANAPQVIISMASSGSYNIADALTSLYIAAFNTKNSKIITKCVIVFAELVRYVEHMGVTLSIQTAMFLLPLIKVVAAAHESEVFQDYDVVQQFVPQILFIIHNTPKAILADYLKNLEETEHKNFYDGMSSMFKYVLACEGLEDPFEPTTGANTREEELEILEIEKNIVTESVNYVMFGELTSRTAEFIASMALHDGFTAAVVPNAANLLVKMLSKHLHVGHYKMVLQAVSKFVFRTAKDLYTAGEPALSDLASKCLEMTTRQLHFARCAGIALAIHLAYVNFTQKRSTCEFMDPVKAAYTSAFENVVSYKVDVFDTILMRYKQFFRVFIYKKFIELTEKDIEMLVEIHAQTTNRRNHA